ncbi:MAG: PHP domain-containing protein [Candidatus Lokiarchaeota archaeon]|nr:PHP domain-containing protein [Candidatus Lokiarchaeota archaeon]
MSSVRLDLHLHTWYSGDSLIAPEALLSQARKEGLNGFAITDHGSLKAYRMLKQKARSKNIILIPGMEIETHIGEIIALFVDDDFAISDNRFLVVCDHIKDENGLIIIPHPFDFLRTNHLKTKLLTNNIVKKYIDGIEIINSRIIFKNCVKKAKKFNQKYCLFETGGSDAHTLKEIGAGYTIVNDISSTSLDDLYESMDYNNTISCGKLSSPLVHIKTIINKLQKGLYFR